MVQFKTSYKYFLIANAFTKISYVVIDTWSIHFLVLYVQYRSHKNTDIDLLKFDTNSGMYLLNRSLDCFFLVKLLFWSFFGFISSAMILIGS